MRCTRARTCGVRPRRCRHEENFRWSRGTAFDAASAAVRPRTIGVAAGGGAEIQMVATDGHLNRPIRNHERAAYRIAHHLHAATRYVPTWSGTSQTFLDTAPQTECRSPDKQQEYGVENNFKHQAPGLLPGCADRRLSSARFAACASGLSGAS